MTEKILFYCKFKTPKHGILKNSKQIFFNKKTGKRFITASNSAKSIESWVMRCLNVEKLKQRIDEPIKSDINAKLIFYFPKTVYFTKKGPRSKTLGDLSNFYCLPEDCLQKAGIIENDTQICSHDGSRRVPIEGTDYYLEIILTEVIP